MEIVLSLRERERGRCKPKHLVDAQSHTFTPKASRGISPADQGQVLWLAGAGCESGAARHCPCGNVAHISQAMCSDSYIKGLRSFFSSSVCFWQQSVLQCCRWGKGSQHEKGGFKAIIFICNSTKHRRVNVRPWYTRKHVDAVDLCQNLISSTFSTRLLIFTSFPIFSITKKYVDSKVPINAAPLESKLV